MAIGAWRVGARVAVVALTLVGGLAGAGQATDMAGRVTLEEAARAFDEAALRVDTAPATEMARWTGPIYLAVSDQAGMAVHADEVEAAVRALAAVARVPVTRVAWHDMRANFLVRANISDSPGKSPCRSSVDWTDAGAMVRAEIHVNLANAGRITRCINHEVMHGFGFRGHAHSVFSVLSYKHAHQAHLTDTDRLILEALYDPRLKPGLTVAATSAAACGILAEKLRATTQDTVNVCHDRGMAPSRRQTVAFAGSARAADQQAQQAALPSLQPGYRDGM